MRSLKELSGAATKGEWSVFDVRGIVEIQGEDQKPIVHWSGFDQSGASSFLRRANAYFAAFLVNAYRAGHLHDDAALAAAKAKGRAAGIEEAAKVAEAKAAFWSAEDLEFRAKGARIVADAIRSLSHTKETTDVTG